MHACAITPRCRHPTAPELRGVCWLQLSLYQQGTKQGSCPSSSWCQRDVEWSWGCSAHSGSWDAVGCTVPRGTAVIASSPAGRGRCLSECSWYFSDGKGPGIEHLVGGGGCLGAVVVPVPRREAWLRAAGCLPPGMPAVRARCFLACGSQLISRAVWEGCVPGRAPPPPAAPQ